MARTPAFRTRARHGSGKTLFPNETHPSQENTEAGFKHNVKRGVTRVAARAAIEAHRPSGKHLVKLNEAEQATLDAIRAPKFGDKV